MVVLLAAQAAATAGELLLCLGPVVGVLQEDERQDRGRVLAREERRVRPELVGGVPEALLEVGREGHDVPLLPHVAEGVGLITVD